MKIILMTFLFVSSAFGAELTIDITSLKNTRGNINIAIWDNANDYPNETKTYASKVIRADGELTTIFSGLTPGKYAVAIFHDQNSDGRLNTRRFGIPVEEFGFSTNPGFLRGQPSFNLIAIDVLDDKKINIKLRGVFR